MSSTAHSSLPPPAPWRQTFIQHLSKNMDSPEFVLSTLHTAPKGSPVPFVPHARYCIYRGMWAELPENKHNDAEKNPRVFESDLPTFTTDVRMEKVGEIFGTSAGHADREELTKGSGGGGPVEAVWWVKDVMIQWRIKGEAFIVGDDVEGSEQSDTSSGVRTVKSELGKRMRLVDASKEGEWSWKREITGHFGNLSPGMRGSFMQPSPGKPQSQGKKDEEKMGEKVTSNDHPVARKNFRVVVIRPQEVEMLDLNPDSARRERYTYQSDNGEWKQETTWP